MKSIPDVALPSVVSQFSEILFGVTYGCESYTIAFLPGRIALCGTPGHQFFLNTGNLPSWRLHEVFRDRETCIDRAFLHKETTTDQPKFLASIESLFQERIIDAHSKRNLREFILKCDCPPRRIREKLRAMGYNHILPRLDFERYPDELISTIEALEKFIANTQRDFKTPEEDGRRSRARAAVRPELKRGSAHRP